MRGVLAGGLGRIGDFGLVAPLLAVALGWLMPPLAELGYAILVPAVILMFAMTVAMVEPGRLSWSEAWPVIGLAVCNLLLSPVLAHGIVLVLGLDMVGGWVVLVAASPAAGAATLAAGLLGLPMRPMLLAQLLCFLALPLTAPLVAAMMLDATVVDPWVLCQRVAIVVVLPTLLGLALRRALRGADATRALRGLGTLGLCGVGLALAHGLSGKFAAAVPWAIIALAVGLTLLAGSALGFATGVLSGRLGGPRLGGAFAMSGGVRNVSLLWSATMGLSTPEGEAVMMLGTLWTFVVPALLSLPGKQWHGRWRAFLRLPPRANPARPRGMITRQFRTDHRARMPGTQIARPRQTPPGAHAPRDLSPRVAPLCDEVPLSPAAGPYHQKRRYVSGPPSFEGWAVPTGCRVDHAFGRGHL